jgi:molybdenum cofactor cytidylyltransferase
MGDLKQLLPLGDSTILEKTIDNLLKSRVKEVVVVLGYRAGEITSRIDCKPICLVVNPRYSRGMGSSILEGIKRVRPEAEAVMLALADQPFIDSSILNTLIESFSSQNKGIIIPTYRGLRGHPVVISLKYKEELLSLTGDGGARQILARHPEDVLEVPVDSPGVTLDIDTRDDYLRMDRG